MAATDIPPQLSRRVVNLGAVTTAISIDASLGTDFNATVNGNATVTITNPTDGQGLILSFTQGAGGSHTIALGSQVVYSADIPSFTASTTAALVDVIGLKYSAAAGKWRVVAAVNGFTA